MNPLDAFNQAIRNLNARLRTLETREQSLQAWQAPTLINSWANSGGAYATAGYWKDPWGVVHLRGRITGGAYPSNAFLLPAEYWPEGLSSFYTPTAGIVQVMLSGAVNVASGSSPLSLDGISFRAFDHAYAREVLADGPVGYWKLGEQIVAVAVDSSGNGNTGTYTGGVTLAQTGALTGDADTAALFDGTTGYVTVPNAAVAGITTQVTVEAWIYPTSDATYQVIASDVNSPTFSEGWELVNSSGVLRVIFRTPTTQIISGTLTLNAWNYCVMTYDGSSVRLYLNAAEVAGSPIARTATAASTQPFKIGAREGPSSYFVGRIDEVAIYPTALSAARILAHYRAGV